MSSLRNTIEEVGLSYKKEQLKLILINVIFIGLLVAGYFLLKNTLLIIFGTLCLLAVNYFLFSSYYSKKRGMSKEHSEEFVYIVSIFRIFISNRNNVYQSFNKLLEYSSPWMKERIETLLQMIDDDKSIKPFTDFAEQFDFPIARNMMASIYQMVEQGETVEQLNQFVVLFEQMNRNLIEERKERKIRSFDLITFFPMIGAGLVTLSLTFSMLSIVGDMINVI